MSRKALVVDNDTFFVEFLAELLESRNYLVVKAYDGKEALAKLGQGRVDLLFVDIVMPKMDGKELLKTIEEMFPQRSFPVVAISGVLMEQAEDLNAMAADYFLVKGPIEKMAKNIDELMETFEDRSGLSVQ